MDRFLKITEVAHIFWPFFHNYVFALILTKKGWGYILGDFLTNSSGHTDSYSCKVRRRRIGSWQKATNTRSQSYDRELHTTPVLYLKYQKRCSWKSLHCECWIFTTYIILIATTEIESPKWLYFLTSHLVPRGDFTLGVKLAPRGEICYLGGMFIPSFTPTLYCLEEWRGEQRISLPGDNFTPREQKSPLGVKVCP
jgi:hypothetical protein